MASTIPLRLEILTTSMRNISRKMSLVSTALMLGLLGYATSALAGPARNQIAEFQHTAWTTDPIVGAVFDMQQDKTGFLWLTTSRGVLRFDGIRFETVREITLGRVRDNDILSAFPSRSGAVWLVTRNAGFKRWQNDSITDFADRRCTPTAIGGGFAEDLDGGFWMQSAAGLSHLKGSTCEIVGERQGVPSGMPALVFVDRAGTVWVKTAKGVLLQKRRTSDRFEPWPGELLGPSVTGYMHQAPDGSLWLSDGSGLQELLDKDGKVTHSAVIQTIGTAVAPLGDFTFAQDGRLWLASAKGLLRVQLTNEGTIARDSVQTFATKDGITSNALWRMLSDDQGNVWVGTNSGLDRLRPTLLHPLAMGDLQEHEFAAVAVPDGVWFGNARSPLTFHSVSGEDKTFAAIESVSTLRRDRVGRIWVASQANPRLSYIDKGTVEAVPFPNQDVEPVLSIAFDRENNPWIVNRLGTVFRYSQGKWLDQSAQLKKRPGVLGAITADDAGIIWIAFSDKLFRWDGSSYQQFSSTDPSTNVSVSTMAARGGKVWLAGRGGLVLFSGGRFQATTWQNPELPGRISGIVASPNGDLWLNGFSGAAYVPASEVQAFLHAPTHPIVGRQLDALDGLPGFSAERIPEPSLSETDDGKTVWFATTKSVASLDVDEAEKFFERSAPRALVTSLLVDGKPLSLVGDLRLPPLPHRLSIFYTALALSEPERVQFRYQLSGADDQWQDGGQSREASYSRLSAGKHTFRLLASVDGIHWSTQETHLTLTITPAFYQTWWFRIAVFVLGLASIYLLLQYRLHRERMRLQLLHNERLGERERIARDLHDTLLQGFHGIVLMFQTATDLVSKEQAARPLLDEALAQSDRVILEGRDHVMDLRKAKSDALETSLRAMGDVWKSSRDGAFRVAVHGIPRALNVIVSDEICLIAREAISNAFRHAHASEILVEIDYGPSEFKLIIRDDGRGIDPSILASGTRPGHWGLPGMRERAKSMGADLSVKSQSAKGTEIMLRIATMLAYASTKKKSPVTRASDFFSYRARLARLKPKMPLSK